MVFALGWFLGGTTQKHSKQQGSIRFAMKETDRLLQDIKNELTFMQASFLEKSKIEDLLKLILKELKEIKTELGKK